MKLFLLFLIIGSLLLSCNKDPNLEPPKHDDYEVIDFDDYAFQLYCIENFDLNKDGQIQYFEVKNVEGIDVTKKQIKSLKGIEYFTNLGVLFCSMNEIQSLDVSKNLRLNTLYCSNNKLSALILGSKKLLTQLECDNNLLQNIDVSQNDLLRTFVCYNNLLTAFPQGLLNTPNLQECILYKNNITGQLPTEIGNLKELKTLNIANNKLTGKIPQEVSSHPNWKIWNPMVNIYPQQPGYGFEFSREQKIAMEKEALIALYKATHGDNWQNNTNWLSNQPVGEWKGVSTNREGLITLIHLGNNQLSGNIPDEIGNLTNLYTLYLGDNQLSGNIPDEIGNLTNLQTLYLSRNPLSGNIPDEIGNLTNLQTLALRDSQLSGNIPDEIGNLTNLRDLDLGGNLLFGNIPDEIGKLTNLQTLYLDGNQLSGNIPDEIGNLTKLASLNFNYNQLSGSLPTSVSRLTQLTSNYSFQLIKNNLSGVIPSEIKDMPNWSTIKSGLAPQQPGYGFTNLD